MNQCSSCTGDVNVFNCVVSASNIVFAYQFGYFVSISIVFFPWIWEAGIYDTQLQHTKRHSFSLTHSCGWTRSGGDCLQGDCHHVSELWRHLLEDIPATWEHGNIVQSIMSSGLHLPLLGRKQNGLKKIHFSIHVGLSFYATNIWGYEWCAMASEYIVMLHKRAHLLTVTLTVFHLIILL